MHTQRLSAFLSVFTCLLCLAVPAVAQPTVSEIVADVSATSYESILDPSTGPNLYTGQGDDRGFYWGANSNRYATTNHDNARDNIVSWYQGLGLTTTTQAIPSHTTADNTVTFHGATNIHAIQPGTNPNAGYIIIGAHYDTAGPANVPGADDNGTGTAGVMEAARVLSQYQFESTIIYANFDLEERFDNIPRVVGTGTGNVGIGSGTWVNNNITSNPADTSKIHYQDVKAMINLDMIGVHQDGVNTFGLLKPNTSVPDNDPLIQDLQAAFAGHTSLTPTLATNTLSDHKSFYALASIPSMAMFEQVDANGSPIYNPNYHTTNDYVRDGYIDYAYATEIVKGAVAYTADAAVPVPEPASLTLLSLGGLALLRRRSGQVLRRRKKAA